MKFAYKLLTRKISRCQKIKNKGVFGPNTKHQARITMHKSQCTKV
jgi:hypothetical protein